VIACISVNDPFVMNAWGEANGTKDKVRMLADVMGEFAKQTGLDQDVSNILGPIRLLRFSMVVEDGVVKHLNVEPDGGGLTCSLSNKIIDQL